MKNIFTILFLCGFSCSIAFAQDAPTLPPQDDFYQPEPPTIWKNRFRKETEKKREHMRVLSRWYVGTDLFGRSDMSTLDNNHRYLFTSTSPSTIDFSASLQAGWIFREQFALEGGYARSKIHNTAILNTTNKGGFKFANSGHAFFLRGKFLIEFENMGVRRSGLWLGGGAWAVPNTGGTREPKAYSIFHYDSQGGTDTSYVSSKTTLGNQWTYGLEASAELALKVNEWSDIAFFLRRHWGYGTALETELTFSDNKAINDTGFIRSDGTGWQFGMSFRFMTGIRRGNFKGSDTDIGLPSSPYRSKIAQ